MKTLILAGTATLATMLVSTMAFAQLETETGDETELAPVEQTQPAPTMAPAPTPQPEPTTQLPPPTPTTTTASAGMATPGPQAAAVASDSDHDMVVGSFGIGYLGRRTVLYGNAATVAGGDPSNPGTTPEAYAEAPVIGARIWLSPVLGIDAGFGFAVVGDGSDELTSSTAGGGSVDQAPATAVIVHAGLPLALSNSGHFSFQVIPEINFGYATQKVEQPNIATTGTGMFIDVGARGGAELHFGFIGVPQLSLQGSLGLGFRYDTWDLETQSVGETIKNTSKRTTITTSVYDNPWNIFTSNVAAIYYF